MKSEADRKVRVVAALWRFLGIGLIVFGLGADLTPWGGKPGIGPTQFVLMAAGIVALLAAARCADALRLMGRFAKHPVGGKVLLIGYNLVWIVALIALTDRIGNRLLSRSADTEFGRRPLQPYFATGDWYTQRSDQVMMEKEGPAVYGYADWGTSYGYTFGQEVRSIGDRAGFLFKERLGEANNDPATGALRVFVLGGSVAQGIGASTPDKTWFRLLERQLTEKLGRKVLVITAAMNAHTSTQERLILDALVLPRKPDAVLIVDGFNDASVPVTLGSRPGDPHVQGVLYKSYYAYGHGLQRWLIENHALYRFMCLTSFARHLEENRQKVLAEPARRAAYKTSATSVWSDNLRWMMENCRLRGIPCAAFLQPCRPVTTLRQKAAPSGQSADRLITDCYADFQQQVADLGSKLPVYDLTGVFDAPGREKTYMDICHFRDEGQAQFAEAMLPSVARLLTAPRTP